MIPFESGEAFLAPVQRIKSTAGLPGAFTADKPANCEVLSVEPGRMVVRVGGAWRLEGAWPTADLVLRRLAALPRPEGVRLESAALESWDSSLVAFLSRVQEGCSERQMAVDPSGLPERLARLLTLAAAVKKVTLPSRPREPALALLGGLVLGGLARGADVLAFLGESTAAVALLARGKARFRGAELEAMLEDCGPRALPVIGLLTAMLGATFAYLGAAQLKLFGAQIYVANLVAIATVREMAPLIVGIIMAGRTGASFAAHIGSMQVNEEVDALQTAGIQPVAFLMLPRLLALVAMLPLLCIYGDVCGVAAGMAVGVWGLGLGPQEYWRQTQAALGGNDIAIGLVKSLCFAVLVALSGCFQGFASGRNAAGVGRATTRAVVQAIVLIMVVDAAWAISLSALGL